MKHFRRLLVALCMTVLPVLCSCTNPRSTAAQTSIEEAITIARRHEDQCLVNLSDFHIVGVRLLADYVSDDPFTAPPDDAEKCWILWYQSPTLGFQSTVRAYVGTNGSFIKWDKEWDTNFQQRAGD